MFKKILAQLNILAQCKKYRVSFWQCPQIIILVMGIIIIGTTVIVYSIGAHYIKDPGTIALMVFGLTVVLFIVAFIIIRSFERLAEANRMKSEFISIVSHQLRAPLSNLRWAIELLMSGRLGKIEETQVEYFKILRENSSRMRELVSDLLIVSRIETARLPLREKEFSLTELIKELILEFKPVISASNVELKFEPQENLPKIFADPFQINLVIENLLDNAVRYTKRKGKVEIKLFKKDKKICFEIKDNGVGIPKRDQKYIFQKFFRAENILRYQTQGSGLGLYIAKSIIQRSGGKINFKSEENKGSTFWFTLPVNR